MIRAMQFAHQTDAQTYTLDICLQCRNMWSFTKFHRSPIARAIAAICHSIWQTLPWTVVFHSVSWTSSKFVNGRSAHRLPIQDGVWATPCRLRRLSPSRGGE